MTCSTRRQPIAITYKNRDTFIDVVAWILIVYGAFGTYGSLSQLIQFVWARPVDAFPVYLVTLYSVSLFFSAVAVWCGLGLRARQRSRLRALVFFLWLYVLWLVGVTVWWHIEYFFMSSIIDRSPDMLEGLERIGRSRTATLVSLSIHSVLQIAVILWAIGHLSSSMIREQFEE